MSTKANEAARADAQAKLREWLKPGDTVYTILRHVSRSGMSRDVSVVVLRDGSDLHPNWLVSQATGTRLKRGGMRDALTIGGCGFDAGHELVYNLSWSLWKDGFGCIGEGCPSNDHSNGDRDYTPHDWLTTICDHCDKPNRKCVPCGDLVTCAGACPRCKSPDLKPYGHWHRDGGYALRQRWL